MLIVNESTRLNPTKLICSECNTEISFVIHQDFMEAHCCGKEYYIQINNGVWNCCSFPDNPHIDTIELIQNGKFDPYNTYSKFHKEPNKF